jgi:hypothetical protein
MKRRQLVAKRLAGAGRHDRKRVATAQDVRDDLLLARAKLAYAERVPQCPLECFGIGPPCESLTRPRGAGRALAARMRARDVDRHVRDRFVKVEQSRPRTGGGETP